MAIATVTLSTTTFASTVDASDTLVNLASVSGIYPGVSLYVDRELMSVVRLTGVNQQAIVRRGLSGTAASRHASNAVVYIGRPDQFFQSDPIGLPVDVPSVYPYINVLTGDRWVAVGDEQADDEQARVWDKITTTLTTGALGIRQLTTNTPS